MKMTYMQEPLEKLKADLEGRCLRLRKMNEELVAMLESRIMQEQMNSNKMEI